MAPRTPLDSLAAPFRYPHYHTAADTPEKIDYERLARVVSGLEAVMLDVANAD